MKVGILGIGAIGTVLSFKLDDGHDLRYFNRSFRSQLSILFNYQIETKEIVLSEVNAHNELDWLLICLKEYHYQEAENALSNLISSKTNVAVIRNGINLKDTVLKYTSEEKLLECMIDCPTQITDDGHYHQLKKPLITTSKSNLRSDFTKLFSSDKIQINEVIDFQTENWKKLIESSALGGILCLSGESCWIFRDQNLVELFEKVAQEGIEVAIAEGAKIHHTFKKELLDKLKNYPDTKESSMLMDQKKGNQIEINAKNGIISDLGRKHQIKTPLNDVISTLLRQTNTRNEHKV